ncbi:peptidoglycan DD-metalloendopeptidase family protein [Aliarcobacter butzleri]|uniref:murein hydrolase activator EnvC family protein n=1 Tax=Aliarcobacter butzleri TaxID=28197 RepID=UPI0021B28536|nr:peptidoglycan DD-metalloendopeptidase family protein [Aliarcobacter butzleri]MCT7617086.1 peptidoglycan DD-metalloendopeptidase family protein [Aliarcobacter butzleri]
MIKIYFALFLVINFLFAASNVDKKIQQNQKILDTKEKEKETATLKIKELADKIEEQNKNITDLEQEIKDINADIDEHQKLLEDSRSKLEDLKTKSSELLKEKNSNETEIINTIVEEFSISMALKLASEDSLQELIDSEIFTLLSEHAKEKVIKLNDNYNIVSENAKNNQKDIEKISSYINDRQKTKTKLTSLKEKHAKSLVDIEGQHKAYQEELNKVVKKQTELNKLLGELNILKEAEIKKATETKKTQQASANGDDDDYSQMQTTDVRNQKFAKDLNLDVKKIGSSTDGVQIIKYKGAKTIAPLKSFKVVKNFGTYYDPIYKIKLFNESIVLKATDSESKVVSVLNGKVVYAKKNAGMLDNVVIIQHEGGLHTIYAHLDEIAPTLVVGKWVQKGSVVGRVNDSLSFQVTKDSAHIDPKDLFNI